MNIYISHPYGGKKENEHKVETIIKDLVRQNPKHTYISPIHAFSFMYDFVGDYQQGLDMCIELLKKCDYMIVYGNHKESRGCTAEIKYALDNGIPFTIDEKHPIE